MWVGYICHQSIHIACERKQRQEELGSGWGKWSASGWLGKWVWWRRLLYWTVGGVLRVLYHTRPFFTWLVMREGKCVVSVQRKRFLRMFMEK